MKTTSSNYANSTAQHFSKQTFPKIMGSGPDIDLPFRDTGRGQSNLLQMSMTSIIDSAHATGPSTSRLRAVGRVFVAQLSQPYRTNSQYPTHHHVHRLQNCPHDDHFGRLERRGKDAASVVSPSITNSRHIYRQSVFYRLEGHRPARQLSVIGCYGSPLPP